VPTNARSKDAVLALANVALKRGEALAR